MVSMFGDMYVRIWYFSDQREVRKQQSAIFKWERDKFILYQSLYTLGAQAWEHFIIGSNVSLHLSYFHVFPLILIPSNGTNQYTGGT